MSLVFIYSARFLIRQKNSLEVWYESLAARYLIVIVNLI